MLVGPIVARKDYFGFDSKFVIFSPKDTYHVYFYFRELLAVWVLMCLIRPWFLLLWKGWTHVIILYHAFTKLIQIASVIMVYNGLVLTSRKPLVCMWSKYYVNDAYFVFRKSPN